MEITSRSGPYKVFFNDVKINQIENLINDDDFIFLDRVVANIYKDDLEGLLNHKNLYLIDALESSKSINDFGVIYEFLLANNIRKKSRIFALGGGITQDIACFISSTIYRGVEWIFIPTTLLSQCDSCIGSKSSININQHKNVIGNFYPPKEIHIISKFLSTLSGVEIKSGIGEIYKVAMIDGIDSFIEISKSYDEKFETKESLVKSIEYALKIKKEYIQVDEFDRGVRNIFNYGHSFGHAIESSTSFSVPHGIAVTMGMDIANFISYCYGYIDKELLMKLHISLHKNYIEYICKVPREIEMINALKSDKKNTFENFIFILLGPDQRLKKFEVKNDVLFARNLNLALEFISHE